MPKRCAALAAKSGLALTLMVSACSGDEADDATRVVDLDDAELRALCDWSAAALGGYGHRATCADGTQADIRAPTNQDECVTSAPEPTCVVTVGEFKQCIRAIASDICEGDAALAGPQCAALRACQSS